MKKLITLWAAALVVLAPLCAKSANDARKQAKAAERTLKKDGFKPYELGAVTTNLEKYFKKVDAGCTPILGTSGPCITENLAKVTALKPVEIAAIPPTSIMREFIGGQTL